MKLTFFDIMPCKKNLLIKYESNPSILDIEKHITNNLRQITYSKITIVSSEIIVPYGSLIFLQLYNKL